MNAQPVLKFGAALAAVSAWAVVGLAPAWAVRPLHADAAHKGIVTFAPYQVFPENRVDNGVYLNNRLLLSVPGYTLLAIKPLAKVGRFAFVKRKPDENGELGIYLPPSEPPPRITDWGRNFYHVVVVIDGVVHKKVFRLGGDSIVDLLPNSKTADGVTIGGPGLLFFHVASVTREVRNGRRVQQFAMRLHLARFDEERVRHLAYPITNTLPTLKLAWKGDTDIEVRLADGRVEVLSISQFQ